jgi:hypothetical protein
VRNVRPMNARGKGNSQFMQIVEICAIWRESQRAMPRSCTTMISRASAELSGGFKVAGELVCQLLESIVGVEFHFSKMIVLVGWASLVRFEKQNRLCDNFNNIYIFWTRFRSEFLT